jgi:hypothetical protein
MPLMPMASSLLERGYQSAEPAHKPAARDRGLA